MKRFVGFVALLLFWASPVFGETRYVGEIINITMRTGKGTDHKIIEMIPSGQEVEILQKEDDWSLVRLQSGKEGWVLTRLLTQDLPKGILLEKCKADYQDLQGKVRAPLEEIQRLEDENVSIKNQLTETEAELQQLRQSYQTVKEHSDDLAQIKSRHENAARQLAQMTQRAETLNSEVKRLQQLQIFRWFLSGAGVLLLGILIGVSTKTKRRRSSLL